MDITASFGEWIRRRRKALDLTQDALAGRIGCSVATIRKIEADERRPSRQIAELLADVLDILAKDRPTFLQVARGERATNRLASVAPPPDYVGHTSTPPVTTITPLPVPPTPLIGREAELAELTRLFARPECRLLTLAGPGGMGKTRLALEAAASQREAFADGVAFVSLAPVSSSEFIIPAIAEALGFMFYGPAEPKAQLLNYLREKEMLLFLDNVEHLLEGVGLLSEILQQAPDVKLLVTSRERLSLHGEWVFDLQGLPVPPAAQTEQLEGYSAIILFAESAQRARAGFALLERNQADVARICRLVDGMPLGIELAAAWAHTLSCREIAQEIERNLDFLTATARDAPERHHSIRAVFDHSWKLLSAEEQGVLQKLSLFRGGFTREAAEQVAGAALPVLSALVSKSLLRRMEEGRYDLHELVRQYSAAHLEADPEVSAATKARRFTFYLALAEAADSELRGRRQLEWLRRLEQDHDNLRATLEWALEAEGSESGERVESALQLAGALRWFWNIRGYYREGYGWLTKALHPDLQRRTAARARALEGAGLLAYRLSDVTTACLLAEASTAMFRELGDKRGLADALTVAGLASHGLGQAVASRSRIEEALALYRQIGDRWGIARNLSNLTFVDRDAVRPVLQESMATLEELGDRYILIAVIRQLGNMDSDSGDYASARSLFERSLTISQEIGSPEGRVRALTNPSVPG